MKQIYKSSKLDGVCYDIRGPVLDEAKRMEEEGYNILRLNTGNPAQFGLYAPDEVTHDVIMNLRDAQAYCDSRGIFSARKAIMQYYQKKGLYEVGLEDIYLGNGVSEMIMISMQALLNNGDEILVPAPDYPLWTAAVKLAGGTPVHYICDEESDWNPDVADMQSKITPKTKGIVVINPNNPTGAVYDDDVLNDIIRIAKENKLIIFADEIYEKIVYDGLTHQPMALLAGDDILTVTMSGLSKSHRIAGFRVGWMMLSGNKKMARDYVEGINLLTSMRLCSNVMAQHAVQTSLGGYQSIDGLIAEGGRLYEQRKTAYDMITQIPGITCVKPKGAMYLFPKVDIKRFNITNDEQFMLDLLVAKKVLLVQGTGFNWTQPDHFRVIFLPREHELKEAIKGIGDFLSTYQQK
jgi:alanine-synthesizing transaminase